MNNNSPHKKHSRCRNKRNQNYTIYIPHLLDPCVRTADSVFISVLIIFPQHKINMCENSSVTECKIHIYTVKMSAPKGTHTHTHMHARICRHAHTHTCKYTHYTHTHSHRCKYVDITHTHTHANIHIRHTHTCKYTHHTHTHTRSSDCWLMFASLPKIQARSKDSVHDREIH